GDSITSIQLAGRSRKRGLNFSVRDVFVHQTVEALAAAVQPLVEQATSGPGRETDKPQKLPLISLTQSEIKILETRHPELEEVWPLAPLQEGLLFHALYDRQGPDSYQWRMVLNIEGSVDEMKWQQAVRAVFHRHPNLRAAFEQQDLSQPVQV